MTKIEINCSGLDAKYVDPWKSVSGATVTVAHSRTRNLADMVKNFKIVIVAIGKPELVKADWFTEGQIIVDAGYNDGNVGDVDHLAYEKASYYTPVPGGVGPMTVYELMANVLVAHNLRTKYAKKNK